MQIEVELNDGKKKKRAPLVEGKLALLLFNLHAKNVKKKNTFSLFCDSVNLKKRKRTKKGKGSFHAVLDRKWKALYCMTKAF